MTKTRILFGIATLAMITGAWFAFTSPVDTLQGEYTRIINVHVPSLWLAFLAFVVTSVASIAWLIKKTDRWDRLAASSVEVGVLFTAIGLATGMVWGHAVWGTAWDWGDPRLATTAVMFFVYLGYLALRGATDDPRARARRSAVLGTIAVVQVPLVYFSVNLWRSLHQTQSVRPGGATMPREMLVALLVNVIAFTIAYIALMSARVELARMEAETSGDPTLAGEAVRPPLLEELEDV
jgi:heme exporter protein C